MKLIAYQLITPLFFCLLILYLQFLANGVANKSLPNPTVEVDSIAKCFGQGCTTIGYGILVVYKIK